MKTQKIIGAVLALTMIAGIAACSSDDTKSRSKDDDREVEDVKDDEDDEDDKDDEGTSGTEADEAASESTELKIEKVESDKFVDFDDMSFFINGKKYTLGVTTVQEMINDGVPFSESSIDHKDEILEAQSTAFSPFVIDLADYYSASVSVANFTDNDMKQSECVIDSFTFNYRRDLSQDILTLYFPFPFMEEDLLACATEPDKKDTFDNTDILTWNRASEIYYGSSSFKYTFKDGIFDGISMIYKP